MARDIIEDVFDYVLKSEHPRNKSDYGIDAFEKDSLYPFQTDHLYDTTWLDDDFTAVCANLYDKYRKTNERFKKYTSADILACIKFENVVKDDVGRQTKRNRRVRFSTGQSISVESLIQCTGEQQDKRQVTCTEDEQFCRQCPDVDPVNLPPHDHIGEGENKIDNAYVNSVKTVGYGRECNSYALYNNSFDPRLCFEGLVRSLDSDGEEECLSRQQASPDDFNQEYLTQMYRDASWENCNSFLGVTEPTGHAEDFVNSYRMYLLSLGSDDAVAIPSVADEDRPLVGVLSDADVGSIRLAVEDDGSEKCKHLFDKIGSVSMQNIWPGQNNATLSVTDKKRESQISDDESTKPDYKTIAPEDGLTMTKEAAPAYSEVLRMASGLLATEVLESQQPRHSTVEAGDNETSKTNSVSSVSNTGDDKDAATHTAREHVKPEVDNVQRPNWFLKGSPLQSVIRHGAATTPYSAIDMLTISALASRTERAAESSASPGVGVRKHRPLNANTEPFVPGKPSSLPAGAPPSQDWQRLVLTPVPEAVQATLQARQQAPPSNHHQQQQQQQQQQQLGFQSSLFWQQSQPSQPQPQPQPQPHNIFRTDFLSSQFLSQIPNRPNLLPAQQFHSQQPAGPQQQAAGLQQPQAGLQHFGLQTNNWLSPFNMAENFSLSQSQNKSWADGTATGNQTPLFPVIPNFRLPSATSNNPLMSPDMTKMPPRFFPGNMVSNSGQFLTPRMQQDRQVNNLMGRRAPEQLVAPQQQHARLTLPNNNALPPPPFTLYSTGTETNKPFLHIRPQFNFNFNNNTDNSSDNSDNNDNITTSSSSGNETEKSETETAESDSSVVKVTTSRQTDGVVKTADGPEFRIGVLESHRPGEKDRASRKQRTIRSCLVKVI